jgi:hypothetical protein
LRMAPVKEKVREPTRQRKLKLARAQLSLTAWLAAAVEAAADGAAVTIAEVGGDVANVGVASAGAVETETAGAAADALGLLVNA